ncbi:Uncharacterised protein [Vibrio cholerae]|nr:Uncharacterised protein [Vibrio cholerae]CSC43530.1 Uncharacterised protein [Vibrio cholerae]CSC51845.1 Uncharacterised protein [Vibrio cholerae]
MAYSTDNWDFTRSDSTCHDFMVKTPQIFQRATTTTYYQHIALGACIRTTNRLGDLNSCLFTLYESGVDHYRQIRVTALKHVQNIVQSRASP